ncbi:MAG: hypothetical protein KDC98_04685 [Planctomycetes bacterium]|nr:hypothetical protein [Planctomycetota bacterium]
MLAFEKLLAHGLRAGCAQRVWTTTAAQRAIAARLIGDRVHDLTTEPRPDEQPKYYLQHSPWKAVTMTPAQAARCNAALAPNASGDPKRWLSPRQLATFAKLQKTGQRD